MACVRAFVTTLAVVSMMAVAPVAAQERLTLGMGGAT
jgi:hypothetical protein